MLKQASGRTKQKTLPGRHLLSVSHEPGSHPRKQVIALVPVNAGTKMSAHGTWHYSAVQEETLTMTFARKFAGAWPMTHPGRYYASRRRSRLREARLADSRGRHKPIISSQALTSIERIQGHGLEFRPPPEW